MPVTKVGLVYYADDPSQKIVRVIYPTADDAEIALALCPCTSNGGKPCGGFQWRAHLNDARLPTLLVVDRADPRANTAPFLPPNPPPQDGTAPEGGD